jgi:hypothetical protein
MASIRHIPVHIECVVRSGDASIDRGTLRGLIMDMLATSVCSFKDGPIMLSEHPDLQRQLLSLTVRDLGPGVSLSFWQV